jgi:hypothetical protein
MGDYMKQPPELNPVKIARVVNALRIGGVIIGLVAILLISLLPRL